MTEKNRAGWDAGRFIRTLAYFEAIPGWSWLKQILPGVSNEPDNHLSGGKQVGVILVAGATGGVGKRVVRRLLEKGYQVRSLVRDKDRASSILGDVETYVGDITQPETLTPEMMANVRAVICCTAVRVQPVGGDTPDREKYNQGVKFYQPEIVGDTPERVEYLGVKNLVQAASQYWGQNPTSEKTIFDFSQPTPQLQQIWGAVDDVVMGGVSQSEIRFVEDTALFTGDVSTANSGGFASVRTKNFTSPLDLSGYEGVTLRVRGDGKRYKFFLRTESSWDGMAYSYSFDTVANQWITVRIPFDRLTAVFRAKTVPDAPAIDISKIRSLQLMLSKFEYNGELNPQFSPGGFALQVESISTYGSARPQFILVSSAGVTRPNRPGINLEEEPPAVRLNDQLGGILTWKWRGEEAVRETGVPYTIIRPCALTEEPGIQPLVFDQGDNIKGKVSRDSIAELCVRVLEQPQDGNLTFEVKAAPNYGAFAANWQNLLARLKRD